MADNRKPQKTRYQGVAYVIGGNSYRGRKAFLVAGFVLPAHQDLPLTLTRYENEDREFT